MSDSTKLAKFVNALAILLAIFSIADIAYYAVTLNLGFPIIKSLGTLSISVFLYLSINKPGLFKT
ncbi:hypothetical protein [Thalassotalea sp. ND16A]|uniref:hypothetical protein n=1 Tax=Thalassotalea sp. ND16A TaxID=1535422 RepID=UPI00051A5169|nr:hypothetical protein [Thalassotalea sp. ND16A]KGK01643.1 hypothetical protein ND16A_2927 [Thalassotalea sp. ND16A]